MKHSKKEIVEPVMNKLVRLEKRRSFLAVLAFGLVVASVIIFLILMGVKIGTYSGEMQTFVMLEIFGEDVEIVAEYGGDILRLIWEELPRSDLEAVVFGMVLFVFFLLATRKKQNVIKTRLRDIKKWESN